MKKLGICLVFAVISFCLIWVGCSSNSLQGTYLAQEEHPVHDVKSITFNKDGTCYFGMYSNVSGTYKIEGNNIKINIQSITFELEKKGNTLLVTNDITYQMAKAYKKSNK